MKYSYNVAVMFCQTPEEQGYEIARPSLLYLKAEQNQGQIDISVSGKVVMVAKG